MNREDFSFLRTNNQGKRNEKNTIGHEERPIRRRQVSALVSPLGYLEGKTRRGDERERWRGNEKKRRDFFFSLWWKIQAWPMGFPDLLR